MFAGDDLEMSAEVSGALGKPADSVRSDTALGGQVSAKVIKYDPTKDDDWDFHVTILDGKYAGQSGWMLSLGAAGDDGTPIDQFSGAVISDESKN